MLARGAQAGAKEDTRFLALSGALSTDLSQYGTNLTAAAGGGYETNSARTNNNGSWEIYVRCVLTASEADKVLIVVHAPAFGTITFAIRTTVGGVFALMSGSPPADLWTGPTVPAGDCSIAWSMRPNPDTTGAGDARISEVAIYDHTAGAWLALEQFTHAAPTASGTYTFAVGGAWAGAALVNKPTTAPTKARYSSDDHPSTEFAEDWITARTAYAGTLEDVPVEPVGPITKASTIGDSGYFVGRHQVGYAAAHARALQRRSWSSLANDVFVDVDTMTSTPGPANWEMPDFGDGVYSLMLPWLRWVSVPVGCTHAWMRVQVKSWVTAGAAVPIGVRGYAFNRPPTIGQIGQQPAPEFASEFRGSTLTVDHTSTGTGEWIDLGLVRLPVFAADVPGWKDTVHLCLAYAIDPASASGNDANARLQINAWHARPVSKWTPGGIG
jgi:hypothetical protein